MEMQKICRICMEVALNPINIFKTMVLDDLVANLIIDCADIEVFSGDGCPEIVCSTCLISLENACSLQKLIKRTDNILKELVDESFNEPVLEIEIEGCNIKDENEKAQEQEKYEVKTEDVKAIVYEDERILEDENESHTDYSQLDAYVLPDKIEDDGTMPRWMLPTFLPSQPHLFYCCQCTETFESRQLREQHATEVHLINPNKPLFQSSRLTHSCPVCREVAFNTPAGLNGHLKAKTVIVCPECGKPFTRSTILKHTKTHQKQKVKCHTPKPRKPFLPCQYCGNLFAPDRLKYHVARHINGMDYECAVCGKKFKKKCYLFLHAKRHFPSLMPPKAKNFGCSHCVKAFESLQKLKAHFVVHTNERPYPCDFCELKFKNSTDRRRHRWLKHIESPYTCQKCMKPFDRPVTLHNHEALCRGN